MTQQARRKNVPEIDLSDLPGLPAGTSKNSLIVPVFDASLGAGQGFIGIPISDLINASPDIDGLKGANFGNNTLSADSAVSIGSNNYHGGFPYTCTMSEDGMTVQITAALGDLTTKILEGEFIYLRNPATGTTVIRQITGAPAYTSYTALPIGEEYITGAALIVSQVAYGVGTFSVGVGNYISGNRSMAVGNTNEITQYAPDSLVMGQFNYANNPLVRMHGISGKSYFRNSQISSGKALTTKGDCQEMIVVIGTTTTNNTATELFLSDGTRMFVPTGGAWRYEIEIVAYKTVGTTIGDSFTQKIKGGIKRVGSTTALLATQVSDTAIKDAGFAGSVAVTADDTNDSLKIAVSGENSCTIKWVAKVTIMQTIAS